ARLSRRESRNVAVQVSARPHRLWRVYANEPRGPKNLRSLVTKFFPTGIGARPGITIAPPGGEPPRLTISSPPPYSIKFLCDSRTLTRTVSDWLSKGSGDGSAGRAESADP